MRTELSYSFDQPAAVVEVPQGVVRAYVLTTGLLAVLHGGVEVPEITEQVVPASEVCFDEELGAQVLAQCLAHLYRSQPSAISSDSSGRLRGRVMWSTLNRDWCPEQEIGLQIDTAAGPVDLILWSDIDWPGLLVQRSGVSLMCIGGTLRADDAAGCEALTSLLSGDQAGFVRHVRSGRVLPAALDPQAIVTSPGRKAHKRL